MFKISPALAYTRQNASAHLVVVASDRSLTRKVGEKRGEFRVSPYTFIAQGSAVNAELLQQMEESGGLLVY